MGFGSWAFRWRSPLARMQRLQREREKNEQLKQAAQAVGQRLATGIRAVGESPFASRSPRPPVTGDIFGQQEQAFAGGAPAGFRTRGVREQTGIAESFGREELAASGLFGPFTGQEAQQAGRERAGEFGRAVAPLSHAERIGLMQVGARIRDQGVSPQELVSVIERAEAGEEDAIEEARRILEPEQPTIGPPEPFAPLPESPRIAPSDIDETSVGGLQERLFRGEAVAVPEEAARRTVRFDPETGQPLTQEEAHRTRMISGPFPSEEEQAAQARAIEGVGPGDLASFAGEVARGAPIGIFRVEQEALEPITQPVVDRTLQTLGVPEGGRDWIDRNIRPYLVPSTAIGFSAGAGARLTTRIAGRAFVEGTINMMQGEAAAQSQNRQRGDWERAIDFVGGGLAAGLLPEAAGAILRRMAPSEQVADATLDALGRETAQGAPLETGVRRDILPDTGVETQIQPRRAIPDDIPTATRGVPTAGAPEPGAAARAVPTGAPEGAPFPSPAQAAPGAPTAPRAPEAAGAPAATRETIRKTFTVEPLPDDAFAVTEHVVEKNISLPPIGGAQEFQPAEVLGGFEPRGARPRRPPTQRELLNRNLGSAYSKRVRVPAPQLPEGEADIIGDALERFSGMPERVVPVVPDNRLPEMDGYLQQVATQREIADQTRQRVQQLRRGVRDGIIPESQLRGAKEDLALARTNRNRAQQMWREAEIRVSIDDVVSRAREMGAPDTELRVLRQAYEDALRTIPSDEPLLTASGLRQRLARFFAAIEGTPPGRIGAISAQREIVESTLRRLTADQLDGIARRTDDLLYRELDDLQFIGPERLSAVKGERKAVANVREIAEGEYKDYVVVQHPEWFSGMSEELRAALQEAQRFQRGKMEIAQKLGYPIDAIEGPYLEQLWEVERSILESPVPRVPGKVSIAREREFGDYVEGIAFGMEPKDMSVGEIMEHSSSLMDQAIGDAYFRRLVLERFGEKGTITSAKAGRREFAHPMFRGWHAPSEITNFVDQIYNPPNQIFRNPTVRSLAAATKGTVFGLMDFGVFGTHMLDAVGTGGPRAVGALINRGLRTMNLPHAHIWMNDNLDPIIRHSLDGVNQGLGPSAIQQRGGTLLKYIPVVGETVDRPVSNAIDELARIQYGTILRPMRNLIHEGNLVALHLTGSDITDPAVRRIAADNANAWTGASRGAATQGRKAAERVLLTSYQMTRSEMARLGQIAKALHPAATREERVLAAITLASFAGMVYGVGSAVNSAFGEGPFEFNPAKGDWASIKVGGQTIPIVGRRALIRAFAKSFDVLREEDPQELGRIWSAFAVGKLNPMTSPIQSALGFGYEPDVRGFQAGTLSPEARLLNMAPLPPLSETLITEPSVREGLSKGKPSALFRTGLEFAGFSAFEQPKRDVFNRLYEQQYGRPPNPDISPRQLDAELAEQAGYGPASETEYGRDRTGILAEDEQQLKGALDRGGPAQFAEEVSDFLTRRSGVTDALVEQLDLPASSGSLVDQYRELNPYDRRTETGEPDWDYYFGEEERILSEIARDDPKAARALRKGVTDIFADPDLNAAYKDYRKARNLRREYYNRVPVLGANGKPLSQGSWDSLRDFWRQVETLRDYLANVREPLTARELSRRANLPLSNVQALDRQIQEQGPILDTSFEKVARYLAERQGRSENFIGGALFYHSTTNRNAEGTRNPASDAFLRRHEDTLRPFFPDLYTITFRRRESERLDSGISRPVP